MFRVNNKYTRMMPLTSLILSIVNIDILNIEQLSHLILVLKLLMLNRPYLAAMNDITYKNSQNKVFHLILQLVKLVCDSFSRGWGKNGGYIVLTIP